MDQKNALAVFIIDFSKALECVHLTFQLTNLRALVGNVTLNRLLSVPTGRTQQIKVQSNITDKCEV